MTRLVAGLRGALVGLALALAPAAQAADGPIDLAGVLAGREQAMKSMKKAMSKIGGAVAQGTLEDTETLRFPAKMLSMASSRLVHVFPDGSQHPDSEALPDVWSDRAVFEKAAEGARASAAHLLDAVEAGDPKAIEVAFNDLYRGCKGCHDSYRKREK